ncbi:sperm acrosome membrane-associated protein 4-like [Polypterus senegalus]|uniref:sperm acrosome membrane-associated protein 4-like n=1 Tax=Polypterus senegalus TaxID=55291 RepID=UPI00196252C1|nr:sperm acrosome membrane-associated protein 4-like [Polypterus senegalus]
MPGIWTLVLVSLFAISGEGLKCYRCIFPTISPIDCFKFPQQCPSGNRCLSSTAMGKRGSFHLVVYEKSCAAAQMCGKTGEKSAMGMNFTYTNTCCDFDLCNSATSWPVWVVLPITTVFFVIEIFA